MQSPIIYHKFKNQKWHGSSESGTRVKKLSALHLSDMGSFFIATLGSILDS